ncbi:MAG: hypothetical protein CMO81_06445 [Waddliaceae bacterium]|nr:hypothetical protein [Waddliaceae bacterium]
MKSHKAVNQWLNQAYTPNNNLKGYIATDLKQNKLPQLSLFNFSIFNPILKTSKVNIVTHLIEGLRKKVKIQKNPSHMLPYLSFT